MNNEFSKRDPLPPLDLYRERRRLAIPALAISFVFLFSAIVQSVLIEILGRYAPQVMDYDWYVWVMSMVPLYALGMPLSILIYRLEPVHEKPMQRKLGIGSFLGLLAVCFALMYVGNYLGQLVNTVIGAIVGKKPTNQLEALTAASPLWTNLLFCGILAPVMEELFYRKLFIDRLRRFGDLPAVLISGVVFGLIHGNFYQFFYAALIGILFGLIYVHTGRIRYTVALHVIFNMIGGVYTTEMLKRIDLKRFTADPLAEIAQSTTGFFMMTAYLAFIAAALIGALIAAIIFFSKKPPRILLQKSERPLNAREWVHVGLLNPGTWFLAAVILLLFL